MLSDRYSPQEVESRVYNWWETQGFFKAQDVSTRPPFCIVLPPPNVTGQLHLGHALDHTLQDILIRWRRMSGFNSLWLPGTDHAGIATQSVVERELKKEKKTRKELGRDQFVERVWAWKQQYGGRIVEQMKRLGDSCDWDRMCFTLDEGVSEAVRRVFVSLYKREMIYKGTRLINWSPALESAISDLEVEFREVRGQIYHLRYPTADGKGEVVVATTRPETMLGDTAVAVHPEDERYKSLIGKKLKLPLTDREIPVIADSKVEREFGTGAVKVTPAHDFNDYEMGQRHGLPMMNILNLNGTLNEKAGGYAGLSVSEGRKRVVADLEAQGFLVKTEPHTHQVGHCSRTECVVEPMLSEQWFVKTAPLAGPAKRVVESGTVTFEPESWTKTFLHWMNIIQDWCISRQLWWGHRIPAWTCADCHKITVAEEDPTACEHCGKANLKQDEDVLDTWFSAALWPFSTMGWPNSTETQKTFYPTNVLVTGHDIIFFWVARMMMMGMEFMKDVPFRTVYIHGLIRDSDGKKMSKSSGNSLDPVNIIEEFGADALRFTLASQLSAGRDLKFSTQRLEGHRNFMNKIWNATRFSLQNLSDFKVPPEGIEALPAKAHLSSADQWIIYKLGQCEREVDQALTAYRFSDAANTLYGFVWHQFCDWYVEFLKPVFQSAPPEEKAASQLVLAQVLNRMMRLLQPFAPFISEEIYQKLPLRREACIVDTFPTPKNDKVFLALGSEVAAVEMDLVIEVITAIRNIRGENRIKPGQKIAARIAPLDERGQKIVGANKAIIMRLSGLETCEIAAEGTLAKSALTPIRHGDVHVDVIVPLAGLVDIDEEIKRIRKTIEKMEKESGALAQRLGDPNFLKNAPEDIVSQGQKQLVDFKSQIRTLQESLTRLSQ